MFQREMLPLWAFLLVTFHTIEIAELTPIVGGQMVGVEESSVFNSSEVATSVTTKEKPVVLILLHKIAQNGKQNGRDEMSLSNKTIVTSSTTTSTSKPVNPVENISIKNDEPVTTIVNDKQPEKTTEAEVTSFEDDADKPEPDIPVEVDKNEISTTTTKVTIPNKQGEDVVRNETVANVTSKPIESVELVKPVTLSEEDPLPETIHNDTALNITNAVGAIENISIEDNLEETPFTPTPILPVTPTTTTTVKPVTTTTEVSVKPATTENTSNSEEIVVSNIIATSNPITVVDEEIPLTTTLPPLPTSTSSDSTNHSAVTHPINVSNVTSLEEGENFGMHSSHQLYLQEILNGLEDDDMTITNISSSSPTIIMPDENLSQNFIMPHDYSEPTFSANEYRKWRRNHWRKKQILRGDEEFSMGQHEIHPKFNTHFDPIRPLVPVRSMPTLATKSTALQPETFGDLHFEDKSHYKKPRWWSTWFSKPRVEKSLVDLHTQEAQAQQAILPFALENRGNFLF